jgi:hypothetical protein
LRSIFLFTLRCLLIATALAGCIYSLLLARAQYLFEKDNGASVAGAVKLVPYNSDYVARLAAWTPREKMLLLQRAVQLNPFDSQSWIQLGLYSELQAKDYASAERDYLKAADVNHMYLPKWTLANFYFRRGNETQFFRWAKETLSITPYSPDPVFTQMWLISSDPTRIAASVPDRPQALLRYAWFLMNNNHYPSIPPVVQRLVERTGSTYPRIWGRDDMIAAIEDRLLAAGHDQEALQIWSTLCQAGWISQTVPNPASPITNGNFRLPFYPHGFGWMPVESPGVSTSHYTDQASIRFELSGDQPEHVVLLRQFVPVAAGGVYTLSWHAVSDNLPSPSGLAWHLQPISAKMSAMESGDLLDSQNAHWQLDIPDGVHLCLLTVEYNRALGTVRTRGSIVVSSVAMRAK